MVGDTITLMVSKDSVTIPKSSIVEIIEYGNDTNSCVPRMYKYNNKTDEIEILELYEGEGFKLKSKIDFMKFLTEEVLNCTTLTTTKEAK